MTAAAGVAPKPAPEPFADLAIAKTADRAQAAPGETVTWTVVVENAGTLDLPLGTIAVADPGVELTRIGEPPAGGVLRPGERLTYTGTTAVTAGSCPALANTATVAIVATDATSKGGEPVIAPVKKPVTKPVTKPITKPTKPPVTKPVPTPPVVDVNPDNDRATAQVAVTCPPPAPSVAAPPPGTISETPPTPPSKGALCPAPALRAGIVAPRRARPGRRVRVWLTIRNDSAQNTGVNVVSRYLLPRGATLARLPHGMRISRGLLVMRTAALAPGKHRTVRIIVRMPNRIGRVGRHRLSVTERCSRALAATTVTRVQFTRPVPNRPAVTG